MTDLLVNIIGIFLIFLIIWWFWFSDTKAKIVIEKKIVEIKVKDGVYYPAKIQVEANKEIILRFIREDASPCAESVVFASLDISKKLPFKKPLDIVINIPNKGLYEFTCQMGMYRGKLIVV